MIALVSYGFVIAGYFEISGGAALLVLVESVVCFDELGSGV